MRSRALDLPWTLLALGATPASAPLTGTIAFIAQAKPKAAPSLVFPPAVTRPSHLLIMAGAPCRGVRVVAERESLAQPPPPPARLGRASSSSAPTGRRPGLTPRCACRSRVARRDVTRAPCLPLFVVRVSEGASEQLAQLRGRTVTALAWSPDESFHLAAPLVTRRGGGALELVNGSGAGRIELVPTGVTGGPLWSRTARHCSSWGQARLSIRWRLVFRRGAPRCLAAGSSERLAPRREDRVRFSGLSLMNDDGSCTGACVPFAYSACCMSPPNDSGLCVAPVLQRRRSPAPQT